VTPRKKKQIDPLEQAIEAALSPGNFISYAAASSFVDDVQNVASDIVKIIEREPERAALLFETFIAASPAGQNRPTRSCAPISLDRI